MTNKRLESVDFLWPHGKQPITYITNWSRDKTNDFTELLGENFINFYIICFFIFAFLILCLSRFESHCSLDSIWMFIQATLLQSFDSNSKMRMFLFLWLTLNMFILIFISGNLIESITSRKRSTINSISELAHLSKVNKIKIHLNAFEYEWYLVNF